MLFINIKAINNNANESSHWNFLRVHLDFDTH